MITKEQILKSLEEIKDPEIPTISIVELGIVADIEIDKNDSVRVTLTPTFVGCPALKMIEDSVKEKVGKLSGSEVQVKTNYDVQWNSNKITVRGKKMLKKHGLAPPPYLNGKLEISQIISVECPFCGSHETEFKSLFGSSLCRSIHFCNNCLQSFEQFKPVL